MRSFSSKATKARCLHCKLQNFCVIYARLPDYLAGCNAHVTHFKTPISCTVFILDVLIFMLFIVIFLDDFVSLPSATCRRIGRHRGLGQSKPDERLVYRWATHSQLLSVTDMSITFLPSPQTIIDLIFSFSPLATTQQPKPLSDPSSTTRFLEIRSLGRKMH